MPLRQVSLERAFVDHGLYLANGVKDRGMVETAEIPAKLWIAHLWVDLRLDLPHDEVLHRHDVLKPSAVCHLGVGQAEI